MNKLDHPHPYRPILKRLVPPPAENTENICIQVDRKWLPYLLTVVTPLMVDRTWESDAERATEEASSLVQAIMLSECVEPGLPEDGDCTEYAPVNAPLWWGPTNPFINPYDIPPGYILPPWTVVPDAGVFLGITGLEKGDVITTPLSFPIGIPPLHPDITKFRIYCSGSGTVEIHLIQLPLGGVALITNDDDLLTLKTVELNKDLLQVPPETVSIFIHEVKLETGGDHHIDVTFERRLGDDLTPVGFGGGLRKVVLCGFDLPGESVDVRQNVDAPCTLEKSVDGTNWTPFANLQLCPPKIRVDKGKVQVFEDGVWQDLDQPDERTDGSTEPPYPEGEVPSGQTGNCLAAENIVATFSSALTQIRQGLESGLALASITATVAGIGSIFISPALFLATASGVVALGATLGVAGINDMLADDTLEKFKCAIAQKASPDGSITATQYNAIYAQIGSTISGIPGDIIQNWIDGFGAVGLTRQGRSAGITSGDCDECPDIVSITYAQGSGPISVNVGDEFTVNPGDYGEFGGYSQFGIIFNKCVNVQWVSGDVALRPGGGVDFFWNVYDPDNNPACSGETNTYYVTSTDATMVNSHIGETHAARQMSSVAQHNRANVVLKIVSVV